MNKVFVLLVVVLTMMACGIQKVEKISLPVAPKMYHFEGDYVTDHYAQRAEGYDWGVVRIESRGDDSYNISIRSRIDKKKPTMRLDGIARTIGRDTLMMVDKSDAFIYFIKKGDTLSIDSNIPKVLYWYCSGGASLRGDYTKIDAELDTQTMDNRSFARFLSMKQYGLQVDLIGNQLVLTPYGYEYSKGAFKYTIEGEALIDCEVADLNRDGYPEFLCYLTSHGSGSYGRLIALSSNGGLSLSGIHLPEMLENKEANDGYMGHDEMRVVEDVLVRRYPIYKENDPNSNPSGGMRQIQYKLVDGEACRILKIDQIINY